MDQSGCKEVWIYEPTLIQTITTHHCYNCKPFPISEVRRFLPAKTIDRWESIKQDKAIKEADIEGLEVSVIVVLSVSLMPILHVNVVVPILSLFHHY